MAELEPLFEFQLVGNEIKLVGGFDEPPEEEILTYSDTELEGAADSDMLKNPASQNDELTKEMIAELINEPSTEEETLVGGDDILNEFRESFDDEQSVIQVDDITFII